MELSKQQSAVILETDENGEIIVNVASSDYKGLTGSLCTAIATKLMTDEAFQEELMGMLEVDSDQ